MKDIIRIAGALALVASSTSTPLSGSPPKFTIETIAGNGREGDISGPAHALSAPVGLPFGVETGPDGALYITTIGSHRVLRLDRTSGQLTSVAGSGVKGYSGDGGLATQARLNEPYEVRFDKRGNMYFVEMQNHLIRRVDSATRTISTVAGDGQAGFAGDAGPARSARFKQPHSIALDERGQLYVADIGNHRIRRIDLEKGTIATIAGTGERELPPDGQRAQGKPILGPRALAISGRTMWIALREGNSVWKLDLDRGTIQHVAGTGKAGYSGDGGLAKQATFNGPKGIAVSADGTVLVVDSENQVVRAIEPDSGLIYTVAGRGPQSRGFGGEKGPALEAQFDRPHGIGTAPDGGFYLGDTNNHRVRWTRP
jgi:DNA-binding beta-propeller fold protein YncE